MDGAEGVTRCKLGYSKAKDEDLDSLSDSGLDELSELEDDSTMDSLEKEQGKAGSALEG